LKFKDLHPVTLVSNTGWNGEKVKAEIRKAENILGKIKYAVSDKESAIKKALELLDMPHVHDITHRVGNILKKIYKDDPEFELFTKNIAKLRLDVQQSKIAYILPPQQRTHSRFINLKPLIKWSVMALECVNQIRSQENKEVNEEETEKKLDWITKNKSLINELNRIIDVIEKIFTLVKSSGLNADTISTCSVMLSKLSGIRSRLLRKEFTIYFDEVLEVIKNSESLSKVLCTSDIIESSFGKYKNNLNKSSINGITDLALYIPALTVELNEKVKEIFEEIETKTVEKWSDDNIGKSLLKQRMEFFSRYEKRGHKKYKKAL
jgi:hypothetical protein